MRFIGVTSKSDSSKLAMLAMKSKPVGKFRLPPNGAAIWHLTRCGRIHLRVKLDPEQAVFVIRDDGPGFNSAESARTRRSECFERR